MGRFSKDTKQLKPSGFGIVVDKSKATKTLRFREDEYDHIINKNQSSDSLEDGNIVILSRVILIIELISIIALIISLFALFD
ncbi:MAG TPA: hypothetical protein VJ892_00670 [Candidatus Absconditabacterales bacterium]|nr:hypothetical protein [Candidatus Absconditabacterales bacterium]